ncbi:MAG: glycosyltransferase family 2 protein [Rhodothermaceae bacterium]
MTYKNTLAILNCSSDTETVIKFENFLKCDFVEQLINITASDLFDANNLSSSIENIESSYLLILLEDKKIDISLSSLNRFFQSATDTKAGIIYSDYYDVENKTLKPHPVIDYQLGSVRDNFDFGPVVLVDLKLLKEALNKSESYKYSAFYFSRLFISTKAEIIRLPEFLYSSEKTENRTTGEKQFDYVNPLNREVQIEYEKAFTKYLKLIDAYLKPEFQQVKNSEEKYEVTATVLIPVKNRVKTIKDAVKSVLSQKTNFSFNLIVVDNHSTDGTREAVEGFCELDHRVILAVPEKKNLNIGGCWNYGINHSSCGKYVIQLDSDDIYKNKNTIQKIVEKFEAENSAMVIGSYELTDFNLKELPPGLIDHKEWTPDNGRNNALRINGLGAPRAFRKSIVKNIGFPDVSYGEDYFIGLAISRKYIISRIYESLYICRRWEGNSDANLDIEKENKNNLYKDRIRTLEILSRINLNKNED